MGGGTSGRFCFCHVGLSEFNKSLTLKESSGSQRVKASRPRHSCYAGIRNEHKEKEGRGLASL